jgi:GNAT superfamily N-acetyltransferase
MDHSIVIRSATPGDATLIANFIIELALYERLEEGAKPEISDLESHLATDANPRLHALIAEINDEPVGVAIYFHRYSTFKTNWGIHLEDLFVRESARGMGIGKRLITNLVRREIVHGCRFLSLNVLNWNKDAARLYSSLGGEEDKGWIPYHFDETVLLAIARLE